MMRIFFTNMNISDFNLYLLRVFKKLRNIQGRLYLGIIYMDMVFVPYAYDNFCKRCIYEFVYICFSLYSYVI